MTSSAPQPLATYWLNATLNVRGMVGVVRYSTSLDRSDSNTNFTLAMLANELKQLLKSSQ